MKKFNTTGLCIPNKHYMVDTTNKINQIVKLIEDEENAVISNILFESCLYDYFGSKWSGKKMVSAGEKSQFYFFVS